MESSLGNWRVSWKEISFFLTIAWLLHVCRKLSRRPPVVARECQRNLRGMAPIQRMGYTSALPTPSVECLRGRQALRSHGFEVASFHTDMSQSGQLASQTNWHLISWSIKSNPIPFCVRWNWRQCKFFFSTFGRCCLGKSKTSGGRCAKSCSKKLSMCVILCVHLCLFVRQGPVPLCLFDARSTSGCVAALPTDV